MRDDITSYIVYATASLLVASVLLSCAEGLPPESETGGDAVVDVTTDDGGEPLDLERDVVDGDTPPDLDGQDGDEAPTDLVEEIAPDQTAEVADGDEVLDSVHDPDDDVDSVDDTADDALDESDTVDEPPDRDCPSGTIERLEECDDGEDFPNDGCSVDCTIERGWSCAGEPSECLPIPLPPRTRGEASTDINRPSWIWLEPEWTTGYRVRLDEGDWTELPLDVRFYTAPAELDLGSHLFEVQAKNEHDSWSFSARFTTVIERFHNVGYWTGVARELAETPIGRPVAAVCQQCFAVEAGSSSDDTIGKILDAMTEGVDIVDLWIKQEGDSLYVDSLDAGGVDGVLLADLLSKSTIASADFLLRLTLSEDTIGASFARSVLDLIDTEREGVARNGRPIIIQLPYDKRESVSVFLGELGDGDYPFIERYVRFHVSFGNGDLGDIDAFQTAMSDLLDQGVDSVSFHTHQTGLFALIQYARSLGLGVEVSDLPEDTAPFLAAMLREDVDSVGIETDLEPMRDTIGLDNQLGYVNVSPADSETLQLDYFRDNSDSYRFSVAGTGEPTLRSFGTGAPLFGSVLAFDRDESQVLSLYDGDHTSGVLIALVIQFSDLDSIGTRERRALVSKAGADDGWVLDIFGDLLRFGVHVDDEWVYASYPMALFQEDRSYIIIGAFSGDGDVHLLVDFNTDFVSTRYSFGDVTSNDLPITIGAYLTSDLEHEAFSSGFIQMIQIQNWEDH